MKYYEGDKRFKGVYSRNHLPAVVKDGAYVINLDDLGSCGTHWVVVYCDGNDVTYFDSFRVEHVTVV